MKLLLAGKFSFEDGEDFGSVAEPSKMKTHENSSHRKNTQEIPLNSMCSNYGFLL